MLTYKESKGQAFATLEGNWGKAAIASLIYFVIPAVLSSGGSFAFPKSPEQLLGASDGWSVIVGILLLPLSWGYCYYFLKMSRRQGVDYGTLFEGFKGYLRICLTMLLMQIYICLWALLLIVPGIIKSYSYAMTPFILADDPNIKYDEAIEKSMKMMDGKKTELFLIDLSMIGWFLLSCLTLGIGFLFSYPYNVSAHAHFYESIKEDLYNA